MSGTAQRHTVTITGANRPAPNNLRATTEARREINDLINDKIQWSLYIRALTLMQETPGRNADGEIEPMSWFGLASIHGKPDDVWDKADSQLLNPHINEYCTHRAVVFPTWHRGYLAVFEQAVQAAAVQTASTYPLEWQRAAAELRVPYWDWAVQAIPPEQVYKLQKLEISKPGSQEPEIVDNPLYKYTFKHSDSPLPAFGKTTTRHVNGTATDHEAFETELLSLARGGGDTWLNFEDTLAKTIYNMLISDQDWANFSNAGVSHQMIAVNSIEEIHDHIHVAVGGNGNMSNPSVAAFDPIFWLHHANIDRLLALWQALHPNLWVTAHGTFNAESDLLPLWNGPNSYFKSSSEAIRDWRGLNYTYPEFAEAPEDQEALRQLIKGKVMALYNSPSRRSSFVASGGVHSDSELSSGRDTQHVMNVAASAGLVGIAESVTAGAGQILAGLNPFAPPTSAEQGTTEPSHPSGRTDWLIRVRARRFTIDMSYTILFFFDDPPASEHDWRTSGTFVGRYISFVNSDPRACANCSQNTSSEEVGYVNITSSLYGKLRTRLDAPNDVVEYLKGHIRWRIQKYDGSVVEDPSTVHGLVAEFLMVPMQWSQEDESFVPTTNVPPTVVDFKLQGPTGA